MVTKGYRTGRNRAVLWRKRPGRFTTKSANSAVFFHLPGGCFIIWMFRGDTSRYTGRQTNGIFAAAGYRSKSLSFFTGGSLWRFHPPLQGGGLGCRSSFFRFAFLQAVCLRMLFANLVLLPPSLFPAFKNYSLLLLLQRLKTPPDRQKDPRQDSI